jgi:hypothetical protein
MDSSDSVIVHLQRMIGNQAVQRLIYSNEGFYFSNIAIQPKLKVSQPGDIYEQEADRFAEQVMGMSDSDTAASTTNINPTPKGREEVRRKCSTCDMKKQEEEDKLQISRKSSSTIFDQKSRDEIPDHIVNVNSREGFPLEASSKGFMESRFGYDFSNVRIHNDQMAANSSNAVNALAYTIGNDIVFGQGHYQPETLQGRRLLAHELTHVVQQSGGRVNSTIQRKERQSVMEERIVSGILQHPPPHTEEEYNEPFSHFDDPNIATNGRDVGFARDRGKEDAHKIRQGSKLSYKDWRRITANINLFQGAAKAAYIHEIKPYLVGVTPDNEIETKQDLQAWKIEMRAELAGIKEKQESMQSDIGTLRTQATALEQFAQDEIAKPELRQKAREMIKEHYLQMAYSDTFLWFGLRLATYAMSQPRPHAFLRQVFIEIGSDYEDNLAAAFVSMLPNETLDRFASSDEGTETLDILYEAMITGDVTSFQRTQAQRVLFARTRRTAPEDFISQAKRSSSGRPTKIFPVRFMRVTGGDYAPPEAKLLPNGMVRVKYPVRVMYMDTFKAEIRTLPDVFTGDGAELPRDEIILVKNYEEGGQEIPLPAIALIDYANQAIESTSGKILEVSLFAASFGTGSVVTQAGKWGARLALADRVASVIEIAAFVIEENRHWIVKKFPRWGPKLVSAAKIANTAASIYGIGKLAVAGYKLARDLRKASKGLREEAAFVENLSDTDKQIISRLDEETDSLIKDLDEAARAEDVQRLASAERKAAMAEDEVSSLQKIVKEKTDPSFQKLLEKEKQLFEDKVRKPGSVAEVADKELMTTYNAEVKIGDHTYRRSIKDGTWCRFSQKPGLCGIVLDAPSFPNQLPLLVAEELETAKRLGVRPITPSDPAFERIVNEGRIKWAITEDGELRIIPHTVSKKEISHAVLTDGRPVRAAGEAEIAIVGGTKVGAEITSRSGHFLEGATTETNERVLKLGKDAFSRFGIVFE